MLLWLHIAAKEYFFVDFKKKKKPQLGEKGTTQRSSNIVLFLVNSGSRLYRRIWFKIIPLIKMAVNLVFSDVEVNFPSLLKFLNVYNKAG